MPALARALLARAFDRRPRDHTDDPKGPKGLTTLHEPGPKGPVVADLVFVHGLNGGSRSTWSARGDPALFWPREWLPGDEAFRDVRVHSFGYPSAVSRRSVLDIRDFARGLMVAIADSPVMSKSRDTQPPLVFVAHSMGGLVVKAAYALARAEPDLSPVASRVSSILFLATPHHGAAMARTLSTLLSLAADPQPFVENMVPGSAALRAISDDFSAVCGSLRLMSFFETRPMEVAGRRALVVEKDMAVMNLPNERRAFLDADHRRVAMFASRGDPSYVTVRNALAAIVAAHRERPRYGSVQHVAGVRVDEESLSRLLGVSGTPEEDLAIHDPLPGSCEWLAGKEYFRDWMDGESSSFLWLRGRPSSGKSVLAGRVVRDLMVGGKDCSFFFFKTGDETRGSLGAFLRSVAWQMATKHPAVAAKLGEAMADGTDIDVTDATSVWKMLYVAGVLRAKLDRHQFWVIDAADECRSGADLMAFLARIQERWPVSVLATSTKPVETFLSTATHRMDIQSHAISSEDTRRDIELFLYSDMGLHPSRVPPGWASREAIAAHIADNSNGSFLWVSIVCSGLRTAATKGEVEEVLASVPSDMSALYAGILEGMSCARYEKHIAKALIAWAVHAFRPLGAAEMQEAVEMDVDDRIIDLEAAISRSCGSLLHVDGWGCVQLVHATARTFLARRDLDSEFAVPKEEGHRRLAAVCLRLLWQTGKAGQKSGGAGAPEATRPTTPFTHYASTHLFDHLSHIHPKDDEMLLMLSEFLGSRALLRWIELVATHGELATLSSAGLAINTLRRRRAQSPSPESPTGASEQLAVLDRWGDDLIHLATRFSRQLTGSPGSIHHLIPPFCPPGSAIRQQHSSPARGIHVQGLSAPGWDDCLATITFPKGTKPRTLAAGPGLFAVGMLDPKGTIILYDDAVFRETRALRHAEPVWRLAFSDSGEYLASAGAKRVRIWSPADGSEVASFRISSLCIALAFSPDDSILRVVLRQNQILEWDVAAGRFLQEPLSWTADLEEEQQFRVPTLAALEPAMGLLCVIYRGEDIILWEHGEDRVYDVYEKETGSVAACGSYKVADGATTVCSLAFSCAQDSAHLAATYADGDLVAYDLATGTVTGEIESANTLTLASSRHGRVIAGADSSGNLTLFEAATLRPLYRVKVDVALLPSGLAFTHDGRRLVEVRGEQCRVWEPAVLLQGDLRAGEEGAAYFPLPRQVELWTATNISAIACSTGSSAVFAATEDGVVKVYDVSAGDAPQVLFVQTRGVPVHLLSFDYEASVLVCAELGGRVTVRRVVQRRMARRKYTWETPGEPLVDVSSPGPNQQVLVSMNQSRLLVATATATALWTMPGRGEEGPKSPRAESSRGGARWLAHPTNRGVLLHVHDSEVGIFSWSDLQLVGVARLSFGGNFESLVPLSESHLVATVSRMADGEEKNRAQLWDINCSATAPSPIEPVSQLDPSSNVNFVIGAFGARLVVYTSDSWIASLDLADPSSGNLVRHFCMPDSWVNCLRSPVFGIGCAGEILFVKQGELIVIKRGLEVTESGRRFHPGRAGGRTRGGVVETRYREGAKGGKVKV